jgi:hypothetical protein
MCVSMSLYEAVLRLRLHSVHIQPRQRNKLTPVNAEPRGPADLMLLRYVEHLD